MGEARKIVVGCEDDHDRAVERAKRLVLAEPGSDDEAELIDLEDAIDEWETHHEDDEEGPSNARRSMTPVLWGGVVLAVLSSIGALLAEFVG